MPSHQDAELEKRNPSGAGRLQGPDLGETLETPKKTGRETRLAILQNFSTRQRDFPPQNTVNPALSHASGV